MKFTSYKYWLNEMAKNYENEVFEFMFRRYDVQKAMELINDNPKKYMAPDGTYWEVKLEPFKQWMGDGVIHTREDRIKYFKAGISISPKRAAEIPKEDLYEPGIFIQDKGFDFLIDGWHRAYQLLKNGETKMNMYVINDPKDIKKIKIE